jgi:hypothetical protein
MFLSRKATLISCLAAQCLLTGLAAAPAGAQTAAIPAYFFKEWTVAQNCTEAHAGLAAKVQAGLKFKVSQDAASDGSYIAQAEDAGQLRWAANWNGLKLEYRAGTPMTTVPADFECIPGQESTSSFLTLSNYAQAAEPYYEQEHWYGLAKIHGQLEHVLIFPRASGGTPAAVVVLASVTSPGTVQLDDNGVIHME